MNDERPRRPNPIALAWYQFCRVIAVGTSIVFYPGRVVGGSRVPRRGAYVMAPVHRSYVDWLIVARLTRRRLRYVVKAEIWRWPALGRFIEWLGAFPVHRDGIDRESLHRALSVLAGGEPLVIFPEGTRRHGPQVEDLREGATYLALRAGVPILPIGLAGTEDAMPAGARLPRPRRVTLVVGEPISTAGAADESGRISRSRTRELTERLREEMERLQADALALEATRRHWRLASPRGAAPADAPASEKSSQEG